MEGMFIDEIGCKPEVDLLVLSSLMSTPTFTLIENEDFILELNVKKSFFFKFRRYFVEFESNYK